MDLVALDVAKVADAWILCVKESFQKHGCLPSLGMKKEKTVAPIARSESVCQTRAEILTNAVHSPTMSMVVERQVQYWCVVGDSTFPSSTA